MARPFAKTDLITVVSIRRGVESRKNATVLKVLPNNTLDIKYDDGERANVKAEKCQHKRGRKPGSTTAPKAEAKPARDTKPARTPKVVKNDDADETAAPKFKHTMVMAAMGKGSADGRLMAFCRNPNEETRDAILNAAKAGLDELIKAHGGKRTAKAKTDKAPKADAKPARAAASSAKRDATVKSGKLAPKKRGRPMA